MKFKNRYTGEIMTWKEAYEAFKDWPDKSKDCGFWEVFEMIEDTIMEKVYEQK